MSGNKYGVGLIGAGGVARRYLTTFRDHPKTEIVDIYNRTPGKASQLTTKSHTPRSMTVTNLWPSVLLSMNLPPMGGRPVGVRYD